MNKFLKIFASQIFNSFFPIVIVAILVSLPSKAELAAVFLLINFSSIYLLFSDYSANITFLRDAIKMGGVNGSATNEKVISDIHSYLGIKVIMLSFGFIFWIILCLLIPLLRENFISNIFSYAFIIGYNLNFYWIYMCSSKEYFFIISNFLVRLFFLIVLVLFVVFNLNFIYLMPLVGLGTIIITVLFFKRFCHQQRINAFIKPQQIKVSLLVIKRDWPQVINSFLLMTPSTCISIFIGYIKNSEHVIVFALAEKVFLGCKTLLSIFVNSIYPVLCKSGSLGSKKVRKLFSVFYLLVFVSTMFIYFILPFLFSYFKLSPSADTLFKECISYLLITIVVISINTPFFLHLLIHNRINLPANFKFLLGISMLIVLLFVLSAFYINTVISIAQTLFLSEIVIALSLLFLYKFHNSSRDIRNDL